MKNYTFIICMILGTLTVCVLIMCRPARKMTAEEEKANTLLSKEVVKAAYQTINLWLDSGVEGVQYLRECNWRIDEKVILNSKGDRGYFIILTQDKVQDAELDYIQVMYAAKESGIWHFYIGSLPSLVIPRQQSGTKFVPATLDYLAEVGEKELDRLYKRRTQRLTDEVINAESLTGLKRKHEKFAK